MGDSNPTLYRPLDGHETLSPGPMSCRYTIPRHHLCPPESYEYRSDMAPIDSDAFEWIKPGVPTNMVSQWECEDWTVPPMASSIRVVGQVQVTNTRASLWSHNPVDHNHQCNAEQLGSFQSRCSGALPEEKTKTASSNTLCPLPQIICSSIAPEQSSSTLESRDMPRTRSLSASIVWEDGYNKSPNRRQGHRAQKGRLGRLSQPQRLQAAKTRRDKTICIVCRNRKVTVSCI